ncbi:hypothetical protein [[Kitasatospora] papulosa]|uniref:hypothetical protein n=1 Tax=[Kitasatospora] papulosa TaxID=1464011 RepID=UPI00367B4AA4
MDPIRFSAEVDARPWAALTHAYGSAADVPDCLRALAGEDDEKAAEALSELYGSILHQGSVYEATAHAVPFLARTAAAGIRAADVLAFLGGIAESGAGDGDGDEAAARRAVTAELPLLLASVEAEDSDVRQAAAWAAAMTGAADEAYGTLRDRFAVETDPQVRAELLGGLIHLDPARAAALATAATGPGEPAEVRVAALTGCVDAGADWGPGHHDAMLALLPADPLVTGRVDLERGEPLQYVVSSLLLRNTPADREGAYALLAAALRTGRPEVLAEAAWASESAVQISRSARERLGGPLCDVVLRDPEITEAVLPLLRLLGGHAAQAGPVLAEIAARDDDRADQHSRRWSTSIPSRPYRSWPGTWPAGPGPSTLPAGDRSAHPVCPATPTCSRPCAPGWPSPARSVARSPTAMRLCWSPGGAGRRRPCPTCWPHSGSSPSR